MDVNVTKADLLSSVAFIIMPDATPEPKAIYYSYGFEVVGDDGEIIYRSAPEGYEPPADWSDYGED